MRVKHTVHAQALEALSEGDMLDAAELAADIVKLPHPAPEAHLGVSMDEDEWTARARSAIDVFRASHASQLDHAPPKAGHGILPAADHVPRVSQSACDEATSGPGLHMAAALHRQGSSAGTHAGAAPAAAASAGMRRSRAQMEAATSSPAAVPAQTQDRLAAPARPDVIDLSFD
jgi:hypothetical protein